MTEKTTLQPFSSEILRGISRHFRFPATASFASKYFGKKEVYNENKIKVFKHIVFVVCSVSLYSFITVLSRILTGIMSKLYF